MVQETGTVSVSQILDIVTGIEAVLDQAGHRRDTLRRLSLDLERLCSTNPRRNSGQRDTTLTVPVASAIYISSAAGDCQQYLNQITNAQDSESSGLTSSADVAIGLLERSSQFLKRALEDVVTGGYGRDAQLAPPPPYGADTEVAITNIEVPVVDNGWRPEAPTEPRPETPPETLPEPTAADSSSHPSSHHSRSPASPRVSTEVLSTSSNSKPMKFTPYSDERTHLSVPSAGSSSIANSSRRRASSRSSATQRLSCIAPSIPPGATVLQAKCFNRDSQLRLALTTSTLLQVYDGLRDSLLWELHSNSGQLVQGNEEPLNFGKALVPSPDGSILGIIAHRENQRRLLIVDAESGWVKLEHLLSIKDGAQLDISPDNTKAVLCHDNNDSGSIESFKVFSLVEGDGQPVMRRIQYQTRDLWHGMGVRFAPDGQHIITCTGPSKQLKGTSTPPNVCVNIYNDSTGDRIRSARPPRSPTAKTNWPSSFTPGFHFPTEEDWLVSFPDLGSSSGKTCIMNARLGQTVAVFGSELSMSQKWQVGVQSADAVEVAYDAESGIFARTETTSTLIPRGQTVTLTQFALSANGGREKAVVRKAHQIRSKVLSCKHAGVSGLSPDGLHMFVQQGSAGKVDIMSLAL
ncbi:hypothetical protein K4F52_002919 [Lecanicillium sp. MT-2017a]|nr:hypothetical protein K4F52_002919 [Lecanicillium sp. MT-2017a]